MRSLIAGMLLILSSSFATAQAAPPDPLAPIAWLVGGTWKAESPNPKGGSDTKIEQRMEWILGGKAIEFVTKFDGITQYEGFFAYDAAKKQIVFAYPSASGDVTNGTAAATPDGIVMNFTISDVSGTATQYQVKAKKAGANDYMWTLFAAGTNNGWTPLFQVKYHREN